MIAKMILKRLKGRKGGAKPSPLEEEYQRSRSGEKIEQVLLGELIRASIGRKF